jgi:DNA repair protein RadD
MNSILPIFRKASGLKLRYYQNEAVDATWNFLSNDTGNGIVVLPTGTGKALFLCELCKRAMEDSGGEARIFVLTHSKELVQQNYEELLGLWPQAPAGVYSAGLNKRDRTSSLIFGSIQSVHRRAYELQKCHLILVDEAQSIPRKDDTTWNKFFSDVRKINGDIRIVGATATDFRLDSGRLTEGKGRVFQKIIYEYSIIEAIEEGFLTAPISMEGRAQIDTSGVHTRAGDFAANELEAVAVDPATVEGIADEMCAAGRDRAGWILFGTGVKHCMMLRAALMRRGVDCEGVFATEPAGYNADGGRRYDRDAFVADFKAKKIKCLVSVNALAVGFNAKHVDLIGMARPTQSVGLYIQIVGRGTRPLYAPGFDLETKEGRLQAIQLGQKPNTLVLDWGGNIRRHGPVDMPNVKAPSNAPKTGDIPTKECRACGYQNYIAARECKECGAPFEMEGAKLSTYAAQGALLTTQMAPLEWIPVGKVSYFTHQKAGKPDSMKATYQVGINFYNEWVNFDHPKGSYPRNKAESWWRMRATHDSVDGSATVPPSNVSEALTRTHELRNPSHIQVRPSGKEAKFFEVVRVKFGDDE